MLKGFQMALRSKWVFIAGLYLVVLFLACSTAPMIGGPVQSKKLKDGIFEGSYKHGPNSATVRITIQDQMIQEVELVEHDAWKGHKVDDILPERIVAAQSTRVDAVSGATNSSHVIMNAVQKAVEKAYDESPVNTENE